MMYWSTHKIGQIPFTCYDNVKPSSCDLIVVEPLKLWFIYEALQAFDNINFSIYQSKNLIQCVPIFFYECIRVLEFLQ